MEDHSTFRGSKQQPMNALREMFDHYGPDSPEWRAVMQLLEFAAGQRKRPPTKTVLRAGGVTEAGIGELYSIHAEHSAPRSTKAEVEWLRNALDELDKC